MACVRGNGCFATGFAFTDLGNQTVIQTLIEQMVLPPSGNQGLWMAGADGGVFNLGTAGFYGVDSGHPPQRPGGGHGRHP